jgi:CDP-diacylglycerol--serine O-phosphatidyltransferase
MKPVTRKMQTRLRRGAYLLPSAFTIGNMLLGFYAVVLGLRGAFNGGSSGAFQTAALLIFIAGVLDSLDGRIARLTGTDSDFGREYDSLADLLTFGAAPALLAYAWALHGLGRVGWLVPLFYVVCCATRLARFNVQVRVVDSRNFVGLPAPAAAGSICSLLFFAPDPDWRPWLQGLMVFSLITIGVLMVSTFRYASFKRFDLRRRWSYRALLVIAAVILVAAIYPPAFFLAVAMVYTTSGPLAWLWGRLRSRGGGATTNPGAEPRRSQPAEAESSEGRA